MKKEFLVLICIVAVLALAGCTAKGPDANVPANVPDNNSTNNQPPMPPPIPEALPEVNDLEQACSVFSNAELTQSLNAEVTEDLPAAVNSASKCSRTWVGLRSGVPAATVALTIIDSQKDSSFTAGIADFLNKACAQNKISLGDYTACRYTNNVRFGKGRYYVSIACLGCPSDKDLELASLINQRIK
ncbi:MAG: hypothetical protein Q7R70_05845 [Candidatus Diapherotrites archaeon]|nr:hypothetical protein [Candidatus Diapherotrites archaeon]